MAYKKSKRRKYNGVKIEGPDEKRRKMFLL